MAYATILLLDLNITPNLILRNHNFIKRHTLILIGNNFSLRFFTFILFLIHANLSLALGLGDIDLKSHLGEKFLAKINVSDIETMPETSCFSVIDTSDVAAFKRANIAFDHNVHQLIVTSNDVITEPIVNLRVSTHCDPSINRDYVLLLDPAPLIRAENESSNIAVPEKSPVNVTQSHVADSSQAVNLGLEKPAKKHRKTKKTSIATDAIDNQLMASYTGKPQTAAFIAPNTATTKDKSLTKSVTAQASTDKPYFVISGGNENAANDIAKPRLSLRLETQIDLARAELSATPPSTQDVMDDVTVMTNRLAHLEKQILSLQARNNQLITDAEKAKNEGFNLSALQSNWTQYLLLAFSIVVALAGFKWLRRKFSPQHSDVNQASWFDAETNTTDSDDPATLANSNASVVTESTSTESNSNQSSGRNAGSSFEHPTNEHEEEPESILDNADVFLAHGRPQLAIQLLQNYLSDFPTESPAIWLKLLNLLSKEGNATEYDAVVLECKQFFNIKMPSFINAQTRDTSTIEDYPHIIARLEGVWGSPFAVGFLNDLIYNQQSQPREGFERNTFEELFFLKKIAGTLNPLSNSEHKHSFYHPDVISPVLGKVALNKAIFSDIEPLDDIEAPSDSIPSIQKSESETLFNEPDASEIAAHDAGLLLNSEKTPSLNDGLEHTASNFLQSTQSADKNDTFNVEEIDFTIPAYEINLESAPEINLPNEEVILESETFEVHEVEDSLELDLFKSKPAAKVNKQAQKNVIEWDLPTKPDDESFK